MSYGRNTGTICNREKFVMIILPPHLEILCNVLDIIEQIGRSSVLNVNVGYVTSYLHSFLPSYTVSMFVFII